MKRLASAFLMVSLASPAFCHAATSVERLSLFIYDGATVYEDRRDTVQLSHLPAGVTASFSSRADGNGEAVWTWELTNTNADAVDNLTITGFIDADVDAPQNTFFNEYGQLLALAAPEGAIAPVRWEIGEPGYHHGDLLPRAATGALANTSRHASGTPDASDDIAMALSTDIDTLQPGQTLTVTAALSASAQTGLRQQDAENGQSRMFTLHARKGKAPGLASSDYAIVKTADTPSVTVGEAAGYTLQVTNLGPDDGNGVRISDRLPVGLRGAVWRCRAGGNAECGIGGGAGDMINLIARIPVGDDVTIEISGTAASVGELANTATISPADRSTTDPDPLNDSSSAVITVTESGSGGAHADLVLVKTALTPVARVDGRIVYQLEAGNAGPERVADAMIRDDVPGVIENVTWTCTASQGAVCATPEGSGNAVSVRGDLPAGGRITLRIEGTAVEEGRYTNTASIAGSTDPNPDNNVSSADINVYGIGEGGLSHTTLITTGAAILDGDVWVWGFRGSAQQGNGVRVVAEKRPPAKVQSLSNVVQLTGGAYHLIALDDKGDIYGWGQSGYGETGCAGAYVATPCKVMGNGVQIAAGEYFTVALDSNGQVWTWGHNLYGQLGNGDNRNSRLPVAVRLNGEKARLIGGAYEGAFAVTEEGHVWAWGDNEASGLGFKGTSYGVQKIIRTPTRVPNLEPYAGSMVYIAGGNGWGEALLSDGRVIGWGLRASLGVGVRATGISSPEPVVIMDGVVQLFARYVGSMALTDSGELFTWGQTGGSAFPMIYGDNVTLRWPPFKPVVIGGGKEHVFYLTEESRLYGVGYNDLYKLDQGRCCGPNIDWPGMEIRLQ